MLKELLANAIPSTSHQRRALPIRNKSNRLVHWLINVSNPISASNRQVHWLIKTGLNRRSRKQQAILADERGMTWTTRGRNDWQTSPLCGPSSTLGHSGWGIAHQRGAQRRLATNMNMMHRTLAHVQKMLATNTSLMHMKLAHVQRILRRLATNTNLMHKTLAHVQRILAHWLQMKLQHSRPWMI